MALSQQVILVSPNAHIEYVLWTLGIPYVVMQSGSLKKDYPLWICQSEQELELAKFRHPHKRFLLIPEEANPQAHSSSIQLKHESKMKSWAMSELPYYCGLEGLDWIGPRFDFHHPGVWSGMDQSIVYHERTIYWGLPLSQIFNSTSTESKAFFHHSTGKRLAHEEVSAISKGGALILFRETLRYLLRKSEEKLMAWPSAPKGYDGVFMWKVDTDGADLQMLTHYAELLNQFNIRGSFFLDTEALEDSQIASTDQDTFAPHQWDLHCKEHKTYQVKRSSSQDMKDGRNIATHFLQNIPGQHLQAHSAPYGVHPPFLSQLQQDRGFIYGSEFGWAYQTWPLQVQADINQSHQWQVPFHPICPQSLDSAHYNTEDKLTYFKILAKRQISLGLPIAWYDHPSHKDETFLSKLLKLAQTIIEARDLNRKPLKVMTSLEYLNWWRYDRPQQELREAPTPTHSLNESLYLNARKFNFRRWKQDKLRKHIFRRKQ